MLLWASEIGLNLLVKDWIAAGPCETCITRDTIQTASRAETQGATLVTPGRRRGPGHRACTFDPATEGGHRPQLQGQCGALQIDAAAPHVTPRGCIGPMARLLRPAACSVAGAEWVQVMDDIGILCQGVLVVNLDETALENLRPKSVCLRWVRDVGTR
mgnify:FL=1